MHNPLAATHGQPARRTTPAWAVSPSQSVHGHDTRGFGGGGGGGLLLWVAQSSTHTLPRAAPAALVLAQELGRLRRVRNLQPPSCTPPPAAHRLCQALGAGAGKHGVPGARGCNTAAAQCLQPPRCWYLVTLSASPPRRLAVVPARDGPARAGWGGLSRATGRQSRPVPPQRPHLVASIYQK
jgi:hypothetical protein